MVESDPSLTSKLKQLADKGLDYPLVLSGSSVSFIEKELLDSSSPLFGRRALQIKLKPLPFYYARKFWKMGWEEALYAYTMIGGTPAYLGYTYSSSSVEEVIRRVFTYGSPLLEEGDLLFHEESFKRSETYKRIMRALAKGYRSPSKLASACGLDARSIYYYLEVLERLDLVRLRAPMGKRKGALAEIIDEYFRFYYSVVVELKGAAEAGVDVSGDVKERLEELVPETFERVAEQSLPLPLLYSLRILKTKPVEVGKWWHKGEEIDLIVRDERSATFVEVKWSELGEEEVRRVIERLKEKARKSGLMKEKNYFLVVCKRCEGGVELLKVLEEAERKGLEL
ncbi:MAG: ATP-binding protein [Crenarchaeota archaeon]|nr:ATP-binding protein [Thermoproteota archaeon]